MTGPRMDHVEFEELISASLAGDLSDGERRRLDAHLDGCAACRHTLAAFADNRRIVAGLRHVPVPRDLHARVRAGIEAGAGATVPWWRRPAVIFAGIGGGLAAVAGAMLALVILDGSQGPPMGNATPEPSTTISASVEPSETPIATSDPTQTPGPTQTPASTPTEGPTEPADTPQPTPVPTAPEPDVYLGHTGPMDNRALVVADGETDEGIAEDAENPGPAIAAEMSPDGQWLAYLTRVGETGTHEVRVMRVADVEPGDGSEELEPIDSPLPVGESLVIGESLSGDPFLEQMFWSSPRGAYLAYTVADPESGDTDVWLFEPGTGEHRPMTNTGNAYAGSWLPGDDASTARLWVSVAGARPVSYLHDLHLDAGGVGARDPSQGATATAEGVFQPLLNTTGRFAIYWDGAMERPEEAGVPWRFVGGAQPYLAEHIWESEEVRFTAERSLFADLPAERDAFVSAAITWGPDGDTYAVWQVEWAGVQQSDGNGDPYPDPRRVYFSRATDSRGMTREQALDIGDVPEDWAVVDVKISPTTEHLLLTVGRPLAGTLDAPEADLLLVDRNRGDEADGVTTLRGEDDTNWWGPAAFDDR